MKYDLKLTTLLVCGILEKMSKVEQPEEYSKILHLLKTRFIPEWIPMQGELDSSMAGEDAYLTLTASNGKSINYGLCLESEKNELQDCMPWKHWKDTDAETDMENIKTEWIDHMHFLPATINVITEALKGININTGIVDEMEKSAWYNRNNSRLASFVDDLINMKNNGVETTAESIIIKYMLIVSEVNSDLVGFFSANTNAIQHSDGEFKVLSDVLRYLYLNFEQYREKHAIMFNQLGQYVAITIYAYAITFKMSIEDAYEDMWQRYLIKNVLNLYRIRNGYKDGTYFKILSGFEDNVIINQLADILTLDGRPLIKDELYSAYDAKYKELAEIEKEKLQKII